MNGRLFEAAQTGKVGVLFELLKEHPLVLHAIIPLTSGETPLHVASLAGQLNFVKEMIIMKPEFAGKLNQDGFSPMHLASANGYLEIVRELMKVDSSHWRLSSGDGRTPLHLACIFQWLFEAAQTGNVGALLDLLKEHPLMLQTVTLTSRETPLHVASLAGHVDFVKEVIRLKPEFAKKLNQDGFSPMHLASANGYSEIVKELSKIDASYCRFRGRDRKTPLHLAVINGRIEVIHELLSSCPESVEDLTFGGQTALHIAVINNQFEAFKVIVVGLKRLNKVDQLNRKDEQGNTVVELMLGEDTITIAIEINALNGSSLTALDIVQSFPRELSDCWKIEKHLMSAGAKKASDIQSPASSAAGSCSELPCNHTRTSEPSHFTLDRLCESFMFQRGRDSPSQVRSDLLIITVLVATATYQAGMSPPGGFYSC
ncbi:hypothetical protein Scep_026537 [Stephania cephalantha]|uniref:PGG domain-containing protein n=1 Tax=Stephania cephalantha TaxID=152367 RepID=A0AAP0HN94_9MAGN